MQSYTELRENLVYLGFVELALYVAISADAIYENAPIMAFNYLLVLIGVYIIEWKCLRGAYIAHEKNLKKKFEVLDLEKKRAKRSLALSVALLILFSSWGILLFIGKRFEAWIPYIKSVTVALPWYAVIFFVWLVYLGHLKRKYVKFVMALIKKKKINKSPAQKS